MNSFDPSPRPPRRWLPAVAAVLFAAAYTQPPLYYSNQNQYFLHGAAQAGVGDLRSDWLAGTADPTPLFTAGVALCERFLSPAPVYALFAGLSVVYFLSLWALIHALPRRPITPGGELLTAAGLIAVHSGAARAASVQLTGVDYPWYFQAGVANQYLLGAGLQPSVFGVFLLSAVAAYAHRRPRLTALCLVVACTMHSTYLLSAATLTLSILTVELATRRYHLALGFAARTLLGVLPVVGYTLYLFDPFADPAQSARAQAILAGERLPHHSEVGRWLDWCAWVQIAWISFGLLPAWRTHWGRALAVSAVLALVLTLVQDATAGPALALLFPWRLTAVLVPVATALIVAWVAGRAERIMPGWLTISIACLTIAIAVAGAAWVAGRGLAHQESAAETQLQAFVAAHRTPGEVYLLPTRIPAMPPKSRMTSASFVPVPRTGRPSIFELQRFRLATGAAAYIDFKSIPYAPADVIEWHRRVKRSERWYAIEDWDAGVLAEVRAAGVTHVVIPAGVTVQSRDLIDVYHDPAYRLAAVR